MTYSLPVSLDETVIARLPHPPSRLTAIAHALPPAARIRVRAAILSCTACVLSSKCRRPVPWDGPTPNRLLVIGEAPGAIEDDMGVPFCGPSGRLLRGALRAVGFDPVDHLPPYGPHPLTFANSVCCRPTFSPPTPRKEHIDACAVHLARTLRAVAPSHVLLVGAIALARFRSDLRISSARGRPFVVPNPAAPAADGAGLWCFPVVHPASVLRDRSQEASWRADLALWHRIVTSPSPAAPIDHLPLTCTACREPVDRYDPDGVALCSTHHARGAATWQAAVKRRAWLLRTEQLSAAPLDMAVPEPAATKTPDPT